VGGLVTAVRDGISGVLVDGHDPVEWARVLDGLLAEPGLRELLSHGAIDHARQFSWNQTAACLLAVYRDAVTEHRTGLTGGLAAAQ
jgi:D-inositol-3-phosphate glycosyltransferase